MKYMTFNSSCSYAGIANMLEQYGIDTNDRLIAETIRLPYLFAYEDGAYLAGAMLQSAEWFDLYLNPIGYRMVERRISSTQAADYLRTQKTAMLGIKMENGGKHAVVYKGEEAGKLVFINNKWEKEAVPELISLTAAELIQKTDPVVVIACLEEVQPKEIDLTDKLKNSIRVLRGNEAEIISLCNEEHTVEYIGSSLNTLFRPLFLDGITMLHLIGETSLADRLQGLQSELLGVLKMDGKKEIYLREYLSLEQLGCAVDEYISLIAKQIA